ncbi:Phospholipase A2, major isoenzyme [Holothuria leucospilota]|uniref:Phospholipase A2 n=1 Tax=Holothuria leucospilota TaxID=206669 RepID=A0A9Q1HBB6_HOLLE|nr:Phospholipase A2, major isoenzyme [Holothuria leucospilota]
MKGLLVLFVLVGSGLAASRWKRDLLQFNEMVTCLTGRNAAWYYNGYGCWCGKGGNGNPVDETDQCCKDHDDCYKDLKSLGTCSTSWDLYTESYKYHYCTKNGDKKTECSRCTKRTVTCDSTNNACEMGLCECDKAAVECFQRAQYNGQYRVHVNLWNC